MSNEDEIAENIRMITDSARAVVPADLDLPRVRALRFTDTGFDQAVLGTMAGMGWLILRLPEDAGGLGLGMREYCALAEVLGSGLVPEPLIGAAMACRLLGPALPEDVAGGTRVVLPAWQARANSLAWGETVTLTDGRLHGTLGFVQAAAGADTFAVPLAGGVALVDLTADGLSLTLDAIQDGGHLGTLRLDGVEAHLVPSADMAATMAAALDEAILAQAAYLHGLARQAFAITLDYLCIRKQFGSAIGSFQALQHRAVDMRIQLDLTGALVSAAAAGIDAGASADQRAGLVSQAKCRATETAFLVAREAIQMHGAIGYTDESDIGLFISKVLATGNLLGSATVHRARYAGLLPECAAA